MSADGLVVLQVSLAVVVGAVQTLLLRQVAQRVCASSMPLGRGLALLAVPRLLLALLAVLSLNDGLRLGAAMLTAFWLGRSGTLLAATRWRSK